MPLLQTLFLLTLFLLPGAPTAQKEIAKGKLGKQLDTYLQNCEAFGFSGSVLVQRKGKLILQKGYGLAHPKLGTPNTPATLFDIASASKQITATAILLLESQGKLDTNDSIAKHLPNVPARHQEVTVYHLLTHTSGFPRFGNTGSGNDLESALGTYFSAERTAKAGERFEYYNGGYAMLVAIVESVTGETFEGWCQTNLFKPAGLTSTDFIETARVDPALLSSSYETGKLTTDYIKGWGYRGMGGVLTSVSDLARWCNALFGAKLLPKKALNKLITPFKDKYACGWYVFDTDEGERTRRVIQHGGDSKGFHSYIRYFPDDDLLVVVLTNRNGWHWQTAWGLTSLCFDRIPRGTRPPEITKLRNSELDAYCGDWTANGESLHITRSGIGLLVEGAGTTVFSALTPMQPGPRPAKNPKPLLSEQMVEDLAIAETSALEIVAELRQGKHSKLAANLMPHIPNTWPQSISEIYWPKMVEEHGPVQDHQPLGTFFDQSTNQLRVWIRLKTPTGNHSIEIAFVKDKLNILNLDAPNYPAQANFAPISKTLFTTFNFNSIHTPTLAIDGKAKKRTLTLAPPNAPKLIFKPTQ